MTSLARGEILEAGEIKWTKSSLQTWDHAERDGRAFSDRILADFIIDTGVSETPSQALTKLVRNHPHLAALSGMTPCANPQTRATSTPGTNTNTNPIATYFIFCV